MLPTIPAAILDTILTRLAVLFLVGAGGDLQAARDAAAQMLASYNPKTQDETRLAAQIISFSFQSLEALSQATDPDMPMNRVMRLRGCGINLSRASDRAQRRLDQLQRGVAVRPADIELESKIEKAVKLVEETRTVAIAAKAKGLTWSQAYAQRQRDERLAASKQKAAACAAAAAMKIPGAARAATGNS